MTTISANAGIYVVTVKYTLPDGSFVNSIFNFILGCGADGLVVNSLIGAGEEFLGNNDVIISFPPLSVGAGCTFSVSVAAIKTIIIPPDTDTGASVFSVLPMTYLTSSELN